MRESAIVDTSALIAFEKLPLSQVLCSLYSEIILPQAVVDEFGTPDFPCLSIRQVQSRLINLLMKAEIVGLISSASEEAMRLKKAGFYVSDRLLDELSRWKK